MHVVLPFVISLITPRYGWPDGKPGAWNLIGPKVFDNALSDEGLTAAVVSHRWHMMSAIKLGLAGRLGRPKDAAVQAVQP